MKLPQGNNNFQEVQLIYNSSAKVNIRELEKELAHSFKHDLTIELVEYAGFNCLEVVKFKFDPINFINFKHLMNAVDSYWEKHHLAARSIYKDAYEGVLLRSGSGDIGIKFINSELPERIPHRLELTGIYAWPNASEFNVAYSVGLIDKSFKELSKGETIDIVISNYQNINSKGLLSEFIEIPMIDANNNMSYKLCKIVKNETRSVRSGNNDPSAYLLHLKRPWSYNNDKTGIMSTLNSAGIIIDHLVYDPKESK